MDSSLGVLGEVECFVDSNQLLVHPGRDGRYSVVGSFLLSSLSSYFLSSFVFLHYGILFYYYILSSLHSTEQPWYDWYIRRGIFTYHLLYCLQPINSISLCQWPSSSDSLPTPFVVRHYHVFAPFVTTLHLVLPWHPYIVALVFGLHNKKVVLSVCRAKFIVSIPILFLHFPYFGGLKSVLWFGTFFFFKFLSFWPIIIIIYQSLRVCLYMERAWFLLNANKCTWDLRIIRYLSRGWVGRASAKDTVDGRILSWSSHT